MACSSVYQSLAPSSPSCGSCCGRMMPASPSFRRVWRGSSGSSMVFCDIAACMEPRRPTRWQVVEVAVGVPPNGTSVWVPKNAQYGYKIGWVKFDELMREHVHHEKG